MMAKRRKSSKEMGRKAVAAMAVVVYARGSPSSLLCFRQLLPQRCAGMGMVVVQEGGCRAYVVWLTLLVLALAPIIMAVTVTAVVTVCARNTAVAETSMVLALSVESVAVTMAATNQCCMGPLQPPPVVEAVAMVVAVAAIATEAMAISVVCKLALTPRGSSSLLPRMQRVRARYLGTPGVH